MANLGQELGVCSEAAAFVPVSCVSPLVCPSLSKQYQPFSPELLLCHVSMVEGAVSSFEVLTSTRRFGEGFKSSLVDNYELAGCAGRGFSFPRKPTWVIGHSIW